MIESREPEWEAGALAYDEIASRYDRVPQENRINHLMRTASLARIAETFLSGSRVLEVGCGTGDEALTLADEGVRVVAIDPSQEMVRIATAKAEERGLTDRATFRVARARDLASIHTDLGGTFDGGYASFSLAYEPDLRPVAEGLDQTLLPDARFLASLPSRLCLVELALAIGTGHPAFAGRRLSPRWDHKVGARSVPIRSYTPHELADVMSAYFTIEKVEALPAIVPPPYMNRAYARFEGLADVLERADASFRSRFPFRSLGDHFLAELRHRPAKS